MRYCAEVGVALIVDHQVMKNVALMLIAGVWMLISTERVGALHLGSHIHIDDTDLPEVVARLEQQVAAWRGEGHEVQCFRRPPEHAPI